jgi:hypothetical protein
VFRPEGLAAAYEPSLVAPPGWHDSEAMDGLGPPSLTSELTSHVPLYRRMHLFLRPARVAVFVPCGDDWVPGVLRTIEGFSRIWGGVGNILIPLLRGDMPESFWPVFARFDPDRLGTHEPTRRGWQMADPEGFDAWLTSQAHRWITRNGGTLDEARALLTEDHLMDSPTENVGVPDDLQARVRARLAPLAPHEAVVEASFRADQPPGRPLVDLLDLDASPPRLQILRTDGLDPLIRLMIAARIGQLSPSYAAALTDRGATIDEIDVDGTARDLSLILELCWRRHLKRAFPAAQAQQRATLAAHAGEDFLLRTPFGDTMRGCGWFLPAWPLWQQRPFVVCGDSAADFCLALALDRCYGDAAWFPQSFAQGKDEVAATARSTLALVVNELYSAAHGRRATVVTSTTLTSSDVMEAVRALLPKAVGDDRVSVAEPAQLPLGRPWRLFDLEQADRVSSEPFVASDLAGELPLLRPSVARARDVWACTWQVDIDVEGHRLPARWALNRHLTPEPHPWTLLRSGTDGISYFSHSMGLVPVGSSLEQALARPRLHLPDARAIFDALLAQAGMRSEDSSVGRYTQATLDLWDGVERLAADLRLPATNNLLHAFLSQQPSHEETGIFLGVQRRRVLSFKQAAHLSGTTGRGTRALLDALVGNRILRRGLVLHCRRCSYASWYRLEDLGQVFTCGRCQQSSLIVQQTWKQPDDGEPPWYYDLDEVVYQALKHDVRAPILALWKLAEGARSWLTRPEADVYQGGRLVAEVDLWAVVDGKVLLGEARISDQLDPDRAKERARARRLAEVAMAPTADEVILATTAPAWNRTTIDTMDHALTRQGLPLRLLVGLGT